MISECPGELGWLVGQGCAQIYPGGMRRREVSNTEKGGPEEAEEINPGSLLSTDSICTP